MRRVLEPEIMGDEEQSVAYARADFSQSNSWYVSMLEREFPDSLGKVLDIGCGPGDVPVRLAKAFPDIRITAIDGSGPMIRLAREAVRSAGLEERVNPVRGYIPGLALEERSFDAVLCKDMIHHLPDPSVLWEEAKRLGRPGAVDMCHGSIQAGISWRQPGRLLNRFPLMKTPFLSWTSTIPCVPLSRLRKLRSS